MAVSPPHRLWVPTPSSLLLFYFALAAPQEGTFAVRPPSPTLVVDPPNNLAPGQEGNVEGSDWESCGGIRIALGQTTLATYPPGTGYLRGEFTAPSTPKTLRGDSHRCFNYLAGLL